MDNLKNKINVALAKTKADLVLKNASIINVYTQTIDTCDIAIHGDTIVGLGDYEGIKEVDCKGLYVAPGFIDSHVHIESSMVTPEVFSHLVISHGVTTVIADPHEIANVMGLEGIKLMLENSEKGTIDAYFMLPSSVPAVDFEDNGATLDAKKLATQMGSDRVLGLGEVMDVNAVLSGEESMLDKIRLTNIYDKKIDGHCPSVNSYELNAYLTADIKTDHECTEPQEAYDKVKKGMYVMLREGTAAKDLIHLLPAVNHENYHRFLFCTDDRHIEDLIEIGSIDHCIRLAISEGLDPVKAITIATLNAAICYHLSDRGGIAPGKKADLVIFEDLEKIVIKNVLKDGKIHQEKSSYASIDGPISLKLNYVKQDMFKVKSQCDSINVIKAMIGSLKTEHVIRKVQCHNGVIEKVIEEDGPINKIAVLERHHYTGKYFTGYIEGIGLKSCAIAQSIAHDSHNIVVISDNDLDMEIAVNTLIDINGGIVIASKGKVIEFISLPIGGIMTSSKPSEVNQRLKKMAQLAKEYGVIEGIDPFITLSFMALPVIPELKITTRGLFKYSEFKLINLDT